MNVPNPQPPVENYPPAELELPAIGHRLGRYELALAKSPTELSDIQRLRFEVFNLELGEGLQRSFASGRDYDRFDQVCHHLFVRDRRSGALVGTYRLLPPAGRARFGYYSAQEFELQGMGQSTLDKAVELGRACVAASHRNSRVLYLLWYGLAQYLQETANHYLFGCCSLTSQDLIDAHLAADFIKRQGHQWQRTLLAATPDFECGDSPSDLSIPADYKLPKLMRMYLEYGAEIVSAPALDQQFKTIDFLALFDIRRLDARSRRLFGLGSAK